MLITALDAKLASWICAAFSIVILSIRLIATRRRDKAFNAASGVVAASLIVVIVRIVCVHLYLQYGTSNDVLYGNKRYFDAEDLSTIKAGSIFSLIARLLITTFYWLQICLLLIFYSNILRDHHWVNTIRACWGLIVVTYIAVVLSTFLECHPFRLYWQIDPKPGQCVRAYVQLFMQGISNIILDLFLLAISFPMMRMQRRTWGQALRVGTLFLLGGFTIIITCVRIAYIHAENSYQPVRSFWASIQMLTSCFVANAPTIYGCFKIARRRKSEQQARRASRPELWLPLHQDPSRTSETTLTSPALALIRTNESADVEKAWSRHIS